MTPRRKTSAVVVQSADVAPQPTIDKKQSYATPRARWDVPVLSHALELPPLTIRRTLGGLAIKVQSRTGGVTHKVLVAESGFLTTEAMVRVGGTRWHPKYETKTARVHVEQSAHCLTCKSLDCPACKYGLAILPEYLYEPFGFKELIQHAQVTTPEAKDDPARKSSTDAPEAG